MLVVEGLCVSYGPIRALREVSFCVQQGEVVTLIGANGAGKSTTLRALSGIVPVQQGVIRFGGKLISGMPAHRIVAAGISQVPEGRRVFGRMTVLENLELGGHTVDRAALKERIERSFALFPRLRDRARQQARTLSGGEQQMLAMARALMANPSLLLMDEPSMGLAPQLVEQVFEIIGEINAAGTTVLLVEQNAAMALSIAHRGYVLENGQVVLSGPAGELAANPAVRCAYLGE